MKRIQILLFAIVMCGCAAAVNAGQDPRWPAPELTDQNYQTWSAFIQPAPRELQWRSIRWHTELEDAAAEARRLQRPILLWAMNGHPCGET